MGVEGSTAWEGVRTLHKGNRDAFFPKGCGDSVVMLHQEERVGADACAFLILLAAHGMKTSASGKCNPRVLAERERPGWGRGGAGWQFEGNRGTG